MVNWESQAGSESSFYLDPATIISKRIVMPGKSIVEGQLVGQTRNHLTNITNKPTIRRKSLSRVRLLKHRYR